MISVSDPTPRRLPTVAGTNKAPSAERDVPALAHDRPCGRNSGSRLWTMLILKAITLCVLAALAEMSLRIRTDQWRVGR